MKINAMTVDQYKDTGGPLKSNAAGEKTSLLIARLAEILDQLEPQWNDNYVRQRVDRHIALLISFSLNSFDEP